MIRYAFLWSHEARQGASEGRKDRPAAIVVATRKGADGEIRVIVAPITHEPPNESDASIEIPASDAAALGLDGERHWIRLDELNRFVWPGFDLRPIPGTSGGYDYGMMPESLYKRMKAGILERQRARSPKVLDRD
ncbi:growth inhibitor PemK [Azospirillum sp. sgz301742]